MKIRFASTALLLLLVSGCGNYLAYRTPGDQVKLASFPEPVESQARDVVDLKTLIPGADSRIGLSHGGGFSVLCQTLIATQSEDGISRIWVFDNKGNEKSTFDNDDIPDEIERIHGIDVYKGFTFILTGVGPNYFRCMDVGPAEARNDLIVHLRPIFLNYIGEPLSDVAVQINAQSGAMIDVEFFVKDGSPNRLVIQREKRGGATFARNPATNTLFINQRTATDPNSDPIVIHENGANGEPTSDYAIAF